MKINKKKFMTIIAGIILVMSPLSIANAAFSSGAYTNNTIVYKVQTNYTYDTVNYKTYGYSIYYTSKNIVQASNTNTVKTPDTTLNNSNIEPQGTANANQTYTGLSQEEKQLVDLINKERTSRGLSALIIDENLSKVARIKAQDMRDNNYFSHTSPTYGSPFDMMKKFGITYYAAGENIAKNRDVVSAHYAFMNSDGHRANILNPYYNKVGVGVVKNKEGNGVIVVEMFIKD